MQYKNIYSIAIANGLLALGEKIIKIKFNKKIQGHLVFVFEVGPDFEQHLQSVIDARKTNE